MPSYIEVKLNVVIFLQNCLYFCRNLLCLLDSLCHCFSENVFFKKIPYIPSNSWPCPYKGPPIVSILKNDIPLIINHISIFINLKGLDLYCRLWWLILAKNTKINKPPPIMTLLSTLGAYYYLLSLRRQILDYGSKSAKKCTF